MKKSIDARLLSIVRTSAAVGAAEIRASAPKLKRRVRRADRIAKFKYATIHCDNGVSIACIAINLDRFGALLRFAGETIPPGQVLVAIPEIGLRRQAVLRWRKGCEAGFEFTNNADQAASAFKIKRRPRSGAPR